MSTAGLASLLPLPIALPIIGAVAAPLLARWSAAAAFTASIVTTSAATAVLASMAPDVYGGREITHFLGHWAPFSGQELGDTLTADPFGLTFALTVSAIGTLLLVFSTSELSGLGRREIGGYVCLFDLLIAAVIGTALTADLINLFVWFEVAALASYGLTGFFLERPIALEAAFKVLVLTNMAGFTVFMGAAMLYTGHGTLNFGQAHQALAAHTGDADLVALGLLVMGFATKAGVVPFHSWLPDAHTAAPGPVSALFSGLMIELGVVSIARITLQVWDLGSERPVLGLLTVLGCISAVVGAALALAQDDLKRLLAYDSISQMGILLVGFATARTKGVAGAVYHLIDHSLFKALLFLCAGAVVHATGLTKLSEMGDLARVMPVVTVGFVVGVAAIAGVPPFNGYVSLGLIHGELQSSNPVAFAVLLLAQVLTVAALARAAYLGFFRRRATGRPEREAAHPGTVTAFVLLAAGCLAFGVTPYFVLDHVAGPAAGALLSPGPFSAGLLSRGTALPVPRVDFSYFDPTDLVISLGTVVVGLGLAGWYIRRPEPAPMRWLRALHTGSVNDYAGYFAAGGLVTMATLLVR
jgi:multicomponent Na+:H+ antiporter subunit D